MKDLPIFPFYVHIHTPIQLLHFGSEFSFFLHLTHFFVFPRRGGVDFEFPPDGDFPD